MGQERDICMKKYNEAKRRNQEVQKYSKNYISERMQRNVCDCGNWLDFIASYEMDKHKLITANFCKWRFCPMCAMRKSMRDALRISVLMQYIAAEQNKAFIFMTLTAPNVKKEGLRTEITRYNKAFKELMRKDEIAKMHFGFIRKLEITYNQERNDYHPHFHVVVAVNRGYFSGGRYVKRDRLLDLWREVMGDYSITQVDVRAVKKNKDKDTLAEGFDVAEFVKYAAKDSDYTQNEIVFDAFYTALKGRQVLTYSGLFATANKKYKVGELEEYKKVDDTEYYWRIMYAWKGKKYNEKQRERISEGDKLFLSMQGINVENTDL